MFFKKGVALSRHESLMPVTVIGVKRNQAASKDTMNGTKIIEVEEGTLVGEELRIRGEGAAINWGKKRGDLIIKFDIKDGES